MNDRNGPRRAPFRGPKKPGGAGRPSGRPQSYSTALISKKIRLPLDLLSWVEREAKRQGKTFEATIILLLGEVKAARRRY